MRRFYSSNKNARTRCNWYEQIFTGQVHDNRNTEETHAVQKLWRLNERQRTRNALQNMLGLGERLDLYTTSERVPGGCTVSALQIAELDDVGTAFDTRNASDSLRMTNEALPRNLRDVTQVTDEEAMKRLGFGKPDAETIARRRRKCDSRRGLLCFDCGHEYSPDETIFYGKVGGYIFHSYTYQKVSYCESCKPQRWLDHGQCDACDREVYFPYRNTYRRHVFCSEKCERYHYTAVQREKRLENRQKECGECGKAFTAPRSDTKFCTPACKQKAYRARQAERQAQ